MSFSKARIQRFNELTSQVPPPGAYDPKFGSKVKGSVAIIDKTATRFHDATNKAAATSSSPATAATASVCSRASSNSNAPLSVKPFRTPQVPKKRAVVRPNTTLSCPRAKAKLYKDHQYEPQQELADLKVELHNKDKTIREYEKLLDDMKLQTSTLDQQHKDLQDKLEQVQRQHLQDIESMASLHQQVMDNVNDKHQIQLESLESQLHLLTTQICTLERQKDQSKKLLEHETGDSTNCQPILNEQLGHQMTKLLRQYFGIGEDDVQTMSQDWSEFNFHPDIRSFLAEMKKLASDLRLAYEREIELSRDHFNEERENLEQQLDKQNITIRDLSNRLSEASETNNCLSEQLEDVQNLYKQTSHSLQDSKDQSHRLEVKLSECVATHQAELDSLQTKHDEQVAYLHGLIEEAKLEYLQEVDKLEKSLEEEKKRMKECADKMIENAEAVTRETLKACRAESEEKVRRIISETGTKIDSLIRDNQKTSEDLSQRELEIDRLRVALEEMKCTAETQESFSQSLQAELDRAEAQLVEKKEELRNLKDQLRNESGEMVARRRRFEVVMAETQASVNALSRRLAQSQADNENLQLELRIKEAELQRCRELLETVTRSSALLRDQLDSIANGLDHKLDCVAQLEEANLEQINLAKSKLLSRLDHLKSAAMQQLVAQAQQHSEQNAQLRDNLREMSDRLEDATEMLLRLEQINDEHELDLSRLQLQISKLEAQLHDKDRQIQENVRQHETQMAEINEQLSKMEQQANVWQRKQAEMEGEREMLKDLVSKYEKQLSSNSTKQREQLQERASESLLAVDVCQNSRSKPSKDKSNLQQIDLLRLRQEFETKCDLLGQLEGQVNEKLKLEARRQIGMGKENQCSPIQPLSPRHQFLPKSANTTPVSSPNKPLRARNE